MIKIVNGDLLEAKEDIIGHQVNCFAMGSGVAKQIKDKYSHVFEEHKKLCNQVEDKKTF